MYETIETAAFSIIGIAVRTTNQGGQSQKDINDLWAKFMGQNLITQIPEKVSPEIYCMYTDYESDFKGAYTTILGCKVSSIESIPSGFTGKQIPAAKYRRYKATGKLPDCVGSIWTEIWQSDIDRQYLADFDVYGAKAQNPENAEVEIYLSVK